MGNSRRWARLMQWLDYLRENNIEITTQELTQKVKEIKSNPKERQG